MTDTRSADLFADRFNRQIAAAMPEFSKRIGGLPAYLGIGIDKIEPGKLWASAELAEELITPSGNVHGGALAAILDHITGAVIYPLMPEGAWGATTELKLNYITPVKPGRITAEANVLAITSRSAVVRGEIHQDNRLACAAQGTITIVAARG